MVSSRQNNERVMDIIKVLQAHADQLGKPLMARLSDQFGHDPFIILISCILSLRTQDTTTYPASVRLFKIAHTPQTLSELSLKHIADLIYPVGFYRTKAETIKRICASLITDFNGKVPATREELLTLDGVGPKTTNLVLAEGFGIPAICVDTHVHRISNRLGIINTRTTDETEAALMCVLPQKYWIAWNRWLVLWGQSICVPISPFCSRCPLLPLCEQRGVVRHR